MRDDGLMDTRSFADHHPMRGVSVLCYPTVFMSHWTGSVDLIEKSSKNNYLPYERINSLWVE